MRHGTTARRQRSRGGNGRRGGGQRTQVFDSNGPDVRIRGTAHQVTEKYLTLAKDSASAGDRVLAESYLQHAEHYQRVINSFEQDAQQNQGENRQNETRQNEARPQSQETKASDGNRAPNTGNRQKAPAKASSKPRDDLALPASILGEAPEKASKEEDALETS